jgi:hypothetical protein
MLKLRSLRNPGTRRTQLRTLAGRGGAKLAGICFCAALGIWFGMVRTAWHTRAESGVVARAVSQAEVDAAIQNTISTILSNGAASTFMQDLPGATASFFPFLHADLAERQALQDPAASQAHAAALADFLNPGAAGARMLQDPSARQWLNQVEASLRQTPRP